MTAVRHDLYGNIVLGAALAFATTGCCAAPAWPSSPGSRPPARRPYLRTTSPAPACGSSTRARVHTSSLRLAEVAFRAPQHPRFVATVDALGATLADGPFMRRQEESDDFGKPETAFDICSFSRLDALARSGRRAQAREVFEALPVARCPPGLPSEDTDAVSGERWGNIPQSHSMVGLIDGAVRLSIPRDTVIRTEGDPPCALPPPPASIPSRR